MPSGPRKKAADPWLAGESEALGVIKKVFILILLAGTFLGGYRLGRRPDSPDIFAWAQQRYRRAAEMGKSLAALTSDDSKKGPDSAERQ